MKTKIINLKNIAILVFSAVFSLQVAAASLGQLKSSGQVGELANGYLGLVNSSASQDVKQMIATINEKRRAIYKKQALKNKISLSEVEKIAAKRNFEKTKTGNYVNLTGKWHKK